ncbi:protein lin-37 homolog isoform X1 [Mercenaria mercenaria]|uniref:protein lin-37 homolog isoform X1 n=1 Tax=Mercenaria mercenaria TaxID=6596 RepID=UPI001E1D2958|nr:protein lin-37 homolog isoform X1 [Mercenaria mercenaria]
MYLSNKSKQGKSLYTKEVSNARTRLDATLQSLVDRKDDSFESTAESDDDPDIPLPVTVQVVRSSGSPAASPVKRLMSSSSQRPKKRKRKHDSIDATDASSKYHHTTYIMKLFDRSVDLAQFNEKTPLYPIARAWMKDNTIEDGESSQGENSADEKDDPSNVFKMPTPIKLKFERGIGYQDTRIPPPLLSSDPPLDIHKDPDLGPAPEELLLRHMARWKNIRQSWINAARINELKYNNSMVILKDMFERNLQSQEPSQE